MKNFIKKASLSIITACSLIYTTPEALACTSFLVGKKASADGSAFITYNQDDYGNSICELTPGGNVKVNHKMQTSLPGLFAAGDLREDSPKQVVCAASDGAIAALSVIDYLREHA